MLNEIGISKEIVDNLRYSPKCLICDYDFSNQTPEFSLVHYLQCSTQLQILCKYLLQQHLKDQPQKDQVEQNTLEESIQKLEQQTPTINIYNITPPIINQPNLFEEIEQDKDLENLEEKEEMPNTISEAIDQLNQMHISMITPDGDLIVGEEEDEEEKDNEKSYNTPINNTDPQETFSSIEEKEDIEFSSAFKYDYYKKDVFYQKLAVGNRWCMLNSTWYNAWKNGAYLKSELGPIDNSSLNYSENLERLFIYDDDQLDLGCKLNPNVQPEQYNFLPEDIFIELRDYYGIKGSTIPRVVVTHPQKIVEVIDPRIPVLVNIHHGNTCITSYFYPLESSLISLKRFIRHLDLNINNHFMYYDYNPVNYTKYSAISNYVLAEGNLTPNQNILIEELVDTDVYKTGKKNNHKKLKISSTSSHFDYQNNYNNFNTNQQNNNNNNNNNNFKSYDYYNPNRDSNSK